MGRFHVDGALATPASGTAASLSSRTEGHAPAPAVTDTSGTRASDTSSSAVFPAQLDLSSARTDSQRYFQSVARIGWQTAHALAYAHARHIIHRDVKPSNLLLDMAGVVWITDFGLAKTQDAALTTTGDIVGTLRYMAPERFRGEGDKRADVYGLGLTLYELLVLRPAFETHDRLRLIDRIKNQEPARPRSLEPRIPRDLETIVLKAIQKEAQRRYQSTDELAEDLRRFLADEPIQARRTSGLARLRLWGRRNPALAALVLLLMLVAAASTATAFYLRATLVESEANRLAVQREQRLTERANADLVVALEAEAKRRQQAREALDAMSSQIVDDWLARQQAKDLTEEQKRFLHKALEAYEEFARDTSQDKASRAGLAAAHGRVGNIRSKLGQMADAEAAYRRAFQVFALLAADFPAEPSYRQDLARTHQNLGRLLQTTGRAKEAEASLRDALAIQKQLAADFPTVPGYRENLARFKNSLGLIMAHTDRPNEAEAAYRDAQALNKQLVAEFPTVPGYRQQLAGNHNNLGLLLKTMGRPKEAEGAYRDALALNKQLAADFPTVPEYRQSLASTHINLGSLLQTTSRAKEAEAVYRDALALQKQLAADFPTVTEYRQNLATAHNNLGSLLQITGRPKEAEVAYRDALALNKQLAADFPTVPDHQNGLAGALVNLGNLLRDRKEYAAARRMYEEALPHHQAALQANPRHPAYRQFFRNNREGLTETLIELGEHGAAAVTASQFLEAAVDPANDTYEAACYFARCVPLAEKNKQLSEVKSKELAQSYGDKAMAALRPAIQNGYKDAAHMKKDTDLDALRGRDDFKKLLGDLNANTKDP